jgi:uncharacterized membrane protein YciS (DUF1049 family)
MLKSHDPSSESTKFKLVVQVVSNLLLLLLQMATSTATNTKNLIYNLLIEQRHRMCSLLLNLNFVCDIFISFVWCELTCGFVAAHPEMQHLQKELTKRRDKRLERKRSYEVANASKQRRADEAGVWSWWKVGYSFDAFLLLADYCIIFLVHEGWITTRYDLRDQSKMKTFGERTKGNWKTSA